MTLESQVAFPHLTTEELECLAGQSRLRQLSKGEVLFEAGQKEIPFFVVKSGEVAIVDSSSGRPQQVTVHRQGQFSGDIDLLTGRPAVVSAVACGDCEVFEVPHHDLRRMLGEIPELSDKLLRAFQMRRRLLEESGFLGIRVLGAANSRETLRIREFFYKNKVPFTFRDIDEDEGRRWLAEFQASAEDLPVIACNKAVVRQPTLPKIAECLGISRVIRDELFDLVIVGAGPAGLAAAVYGGSEGLQTLLVDQVGPGGQAGTSSRIENYMGFPSGLTGAELANRGYLQALKFGVQFVAPVSVLRMQPHPELGHVLDLCTGQRIHTKTVLVSTGASYRPLGIDGCRRLEGAGVYYSATSVESRICSQGTAVVVGGGNSAGQAALFLAREAGQVKILLRGDDLTKSMSQYLSHRIVQAGNIEVLRNTEVHSVSGDDCLRQIGIRNNTSGQTEHLDCSGLFVFIGARPHTDWLPSNISLDEKGFVLTGPALRSNPLWSLDRPPCELETSCPGILAAGDVRAGTTKRVAFAVGDGALAVTCVHQFLSR